MSDLLSSFFAGGMAETYVNRVYKIMNVVMVFALAWTAISLINIYEYIDNTPIVSKMSGSFYRYKLLPAIGVAEIAMNLVWIVLMHHAWGDWKTYLETPDENLLYKGLKNFYSATMLLVAWFVLSIVHTSYITFFR